MIAGMWVAALPAPTGQVGAGPSPWLEFTVNALGAIGTVSAAVVAVCLARRETAERRAAQEETKTLRARERRSQATQVIASVKARPPQRVVTSDTAPREVRAARWRVDVHNTSQLPIRSVLLNVMPRGVPRLVETIQIADVIAPQAKASATGTESAYEILSIEPEYELLFLDAHGVRWALDDQAVLTEPHLPSGEDDTRDEGFHRGHRVAFLKR